MSAEGRSKKAVCAGLFRQDTFPLRLGGAAGETRRETLLRKPPEPAAHVAGFGLYLEGFAPPSLPKGVFRWSEAGAADLAVYRQIENTSAGMQEGAASPFLCHPQRRRVRREERLQAASAIMFRRCASRTGT